MHEFHNNYNCLSYPPMLIARNYLRHELPRDIASQIRSFVRMQWPTLWADQTDLWNFTPQPRPSRHFVLLDGELLLSHAAVNDRDLNYHDQTWRVYGLSTVFTYPDRRGSGFGSQVVATASEYIRQSDGDLAMLFADARWEKFYTTHGWHAVPTARILFGDSQSPSIKNDNLTMMMMLSHRARQLQHQLEHQPIHVGETTW